LSPISLRQDFRTCRLRFSSRTILSESPPQDWRRRALSDRCSGRWPGKRRGGGSSQASRKVITRDFLAIKIFASCAVISIPFSPRFDALHLITTRASISRHSLRLLSQ
jgi:hypothetical protein